MCRTIGRQIICNRVAHQCPLQSDVFLEIWRHRHIISYHNQYLWISVTTQWRIKFTLFNDLPILCLFYSCRIGARIHITCRSYNTAYPVRSDLRNEKCAKHKITPKTIHTDAVNLAFISITYFNQYLKRCAPKFVINSIQMPYLFKFLKSFAKFLMVVEFSLPKKRNVRLSWVRF